MHWIKIMAVFFTFLFTAGIIAIIRLMWQIGRPIEKIEEIIRDDFGKMPDSMKSDISPKWQAILDKGSSPNPSDWKLAVIEADSLMDDLLKRIGYPGETMGERLKYVDSSKLAAINDVWEAHKIRNIIAHDPNRAVSRQEIDKALEGFEKALDELDFID